MMTERPISGDVPDEFEILLLCVYLRRYSVACAFAGVCNSLLTSTQIMKMRKIRRLAPQAMTAMAQFGRTGSSSFGTATAARA